MLKSYVVSIIFIGIIFNQPSYVLGCTLVTNTIGIVADFTGSSRCDFLTCERRTDKYRSCWELSVPSNKYATITVDKVSFPNTHCAAAYLRIINTDTNTDNKYCKSDLNYNPVTALSKVKIEFYVDHVHTPSNQRIEFRFQISYKIQDIECVNKDSFRCTDYSCIPKAEVCDGVRDCENGKDENDCVRGIAAVSGVSSALATGIEGLKSKRSKSWGWHENTARAVTALYLSGGATFNGTNKEEELMAKQTELKTAVALLKESVPSEQLSTFIHALLVTCHDPRHFYGHDLVERLRKQVESPKNFTHPIAHLALCNAGSEPPAGSTAYLSKLLKGESNYPFVRDIQAFAAMTIACYKNRSEHDIINNETLMSQYQNTIQRFKQYQLPDGSFGNNHTTSLITQALLASGEEEAEDWKVNSTVKFLMGQLQASDFDFVATYLVLPLLNRKSLADIAHVKCTNDTRKQRSVNSDEYSGPKMRTQYSLYVGDEKDVVHTLWLRVPYNFTAFQVMQAAAEEDTKYTFEWKRMSEDVYVFRIGKVMNDPEAGMFWLLYLKSGNNTELQHSTTSPDKLVLKEEDHLIMWFRKAHL